MKNIFLFFFCLFCFSANLSAQSTPELPGYAEDNTQPSIRNFKDIKIPKKSYDNLKVVSLDSNPDASSYIVFIKKGVALHHHAWHTEQVYILEGKGMMTLDGKTKKIKKGDYIWIPAGTKHSVKVTSRKPLKVLSIQTPQFHGQDRIFAN